MRQRLENNHAHSIEQHEENPTIQEINDDEIWMTNFAQPYNEVIPSSSISDLVSDYTFAVARGAGSAVMSMINVITHPIDPIIAAGSLLNDAQILGAAYSDGFYPPELSFEFGLQQRLNAGDSLRLLDAEFRMQQREKDVVAIYDAFVNGSGPHRAEMLTSMVLGGLFTNAVGSTITRTVSNLKHFGTISTPLRFHDRTRARQYITPTLLSINEVRQIRDNCTLLFGFTQNRQLFIARELQTYMDGRYVRLTTHNHHELLNYNPVYVAGEIHLRNGRIDCINNDSGRYLTHGKYLPRLTERLFIRHGFTEARGKFVTNPDTSRLSLAIFDREFPIRFSFAPTIFALGSSTALYNHDQFNSVINELNVSPFEIFPSAHGQTFFASSPVSSNTASNSESPSDYIHPSKIPTIMSSSVIEAFTQWTAPQTLDNAIAQRVQSSGLSAEMQAYLSYPQTSLTAQASRNSQVVHESARPNTSTYSQITQRLTNSSTLTRPSSSSASSLQLSTYGEYSTFESQNQSALQSLSTLMERTTSSPSSFDFGQTYSTPQTFYFRDANQRELYSEAAGFHFFMREQPAPSPIQGNSYSSNGYGDNSSRLFSSEGSDHGDCVTTADGRVSTDGGDVTTGGVWY